MTKQKFLKLISGISAAAFMWQQCALALPEDFFKDMGIEENVLRPKAAGERPPFKTRGSKSIQGETLLREAIEGVILTTDQKILEAIERLKERKEPITQRSIAKEARLNEHTVSRRKKANPAIRLAIEKARKAIEEKIEEENYRKQIEKELIFRIFFKFPQYKKLKTWLVARFGISKELASEILEENKIFISARMDNLCELWPRIPSGYKLGLLKKLVDSSIKDSSIKHVDYWYQLCLLADSYPDETKELFIKMNEMGQLDAFKKIPKAQDLLREMRLRELIEPIRFDRHGIDIPEKTGHGPKGATPQDGPAGSISNIFDYLCKNNITNPDVALTGQEIGARLDRSYETIKYDIRALYYHLHLFEKAEGTGREARFFVPESVKKKTDKILPILDQFRGKDLRPNVSHLEEIYQKHIKTILEEPPQIDTSLVSTLLTEDKKDISVEETSDGDYIYCEERIGGKPVKFTITPTQSLKDRLTAAVASVKRSATPVMIPLENLGFGHSEEEKNDEIEAAELVNRWISDGTKLNQDRLKELHKILSRHIEYMTIKGDYVTPGRRGFDVRPEMDDLFEFIDSGKGRNMHPIHLAAYMFAQLVSIHPFEECNGRLTRLVMNYILGSNGYQPFIRTSENTKAYNTLFRERAEKIAIYLGGMDGRDYIARIQEFAKEGVSPEDILALDGGPRLHGGVEALEAAKKDLPPEAQGIIDEAITMYAVQDSARVSRSRMAPDKSRGNTGGYINNLLDEAEIPLKAKRFGEALEVARVTQELLEKFTSLSDKPEKLQRFLDDIGAKEDDFSREAYDRFTQIVSRIEEGFHKDDVKQFTDAIRSAIEKVRRQGHSPQTIADLIITSIYPGTGDFSVAEEALQELMKSLDDFVLKVAELAYERFKSDDIIKILSRKLDKSHEMSQDEYKIWAEDYVGLLERGFKVNLSPESRASFIFRVESRIEELASVPFDKRDFRSCEMILDVYIKEMARLKHLYARNSFTPYAGLLVLACKAKFLLGKVEECAEIANIAISYKQSSSATTAEALIYRGAALTVLGKPDKAREDTENGLAMLESFIRSHDGGSAVNKHTFLMGLSNLGLIYALESDFAIARELFLRAIEYRDVEGMWDEEVEKGNVASLYSHIATCCLFDVENTKDALEGAERYIAKLRELYPEDVRMRLFYGWMNYRKADYTSALDILEGIKPETLPDDIIDTAIQLCILISIECKQQGLSDKQGRAGLKALDFIRHFQEKAEIEKDGVTTLRMAVFEYRLRAIEMDYDKTAPALTGLLQKCSDSKCYSAASSALTDLVFMDLSHIFKEGGDVGIPDKGEIPSGLRSLWALLSYKERRPDVIVSTYLWHPKNERDNFVRGVTAVLVSDSPEIIPVMKFNALTLLKRIRPSLAVPVIKEYLNRLLQEEANIKTNSQLIFKLMDFLQLTNSEPPLRIIWLLNRLRSGLTEKKDSIRDRADEMIDQLEGGLSLRERLEWVEMSFREAGYEEAKDRAHSLMKTLDSAKEPEIHARLERFYNASLLMIDGGIRYAEQKFDAAIECYTRVATEMVPDDSNVKSHLHRAEEMKRALSLYASGNDDEAVSAARGINDEVSASLIVRIENLRNGWRSLKAGDLTKATTIVQGLRQGYSEDQRVKGLQAEVSAARDRARDRQKMINSKLNSAQQALGKGEYDDFLNIIKGIMLEDARNKEAISLLVKACNDAYSQGKLDWALRIAIEGLKFTPQNTTFIRMRGKVAMERLRHQFDIISSQIDADILRTEDKKKSLGIGRERALEYSFTGVKKDRRAGLITLSGLLFASGKKAGKTKIIHMTDIRQAVNKGETYMMVTAQQGEAVQFFLEAVEVERDYVEFTVTGEEDLDLIMANVPDENVTIIKVSDRSLVLRRELLALLIEKIEAPLAKDGVPTTGNALIDIALAVVDPPEYIAEDGGPAPSFRDTRIADDPSQNRAVGLALDPTVPLTLIEGPPGTGKTSVIVELVKQFLASRMKILVVSQSNAGVDNVGLRLQAEGVSFARVGNEASITQGLRNNWSLRGQKLAEMRDSGRGAVILGTNNGFLLDNHISKDAFYQERYDVVIIEEAGRATVAETLLPISTAERDGGKIILVGDHKQLPAYGIDEEERNDIIEELSKRRLKPIEWLNKVFSRSRIREYRTSLFEMLWEGPSNLKNEVYKHLLLINRRSHPVIARLVSELFYDGIIQPDPEKDPTPEPDTITLIDYAKGAPEKHEKKVGTSYRNLTEVNIVLEEIDRYLNQKKTDGSCRYNPQDITTITPYKPQIAMIQQALEIKAIINDIESGLLPKGAALSEEKLKKLEDAIDPKARPLIAQFPAVYDDKAELTKLLARIKDALIFDVARKHGERSVRWEDLDILRLFEVETVDSIQGSENDVIILSLVRSNLDGNIGFLGTEDGIQRLTVAFSRARQKFSIIGDFSNTLAKARYRRGDGEEEEEKIKRHNTERATKIFRHTLQYAGTVTTLSREPSHKDKLEKQLQAPTNGERMQALSALIETEKKGLISTPLKPDPFKINQHVHSFYSYNPTRETPESLVWKAHREGFSEFGTIEFDTIGPWIKEALEAAQVVGMKISVGMETMIGQLPEPYSSTETNFPGRIQSYLIIHGITNPDVDSDAEAGPILKRLAALSGERAKDSVKKLNDHIRSVLGTQASSIAIDFDRDLAPLCPVGYFSERHIVDLLYNKISMAYHNEDGIKEAIAKLLGVDKEKIDLNDLNKLKDLIRKKLLGVGGKAYVEPSLDKYITLSEFITIAKKAGGMPCYSFLALENIEKELEVAGWLYERGIIQGANLITHRSNAEQIRKVVTFCRERDLPLIIGTELNAPGLPFVDDLHDEGRFPPDILAYIQGSAERLINRRAIPQSPTPVIHLEIQPNIESFERIRDWYFSKSAPQDKDRVLGNYIFESVISMLEESKKCLDNVQQRSNTDLTRYKSLFDIALQKALELKNRINTKTTASADIFSYDAMEVYSVVSGAYQETLKNITTIFSQQIILEEGVQASLSRLQGLYYLAVYMINFYGTLCITRDRNLLRETCQLDDVISEGVVTLQHELLLENRIAVPANIIVAENSAGQRVHFKRNEIRNALLELLKNGLESLHKKDPTLKSGKVYISAYIKGNELVIEVKDEGAGIEDVYMPHLAKTGFTIKNREIPILGGFGLGLRKADWIAKFYGGRLEIGTKPGGPTRAAIVLPLRTEPPGPIREPEPRHPQNDVLRPIPATENTNQKLFWTQIGNEA